MIKLIAIDLDGTLLNNQKEISSRNQKALRLAKAAGVKVVICTGRPLKAIGKYLDILGLRDAGDYSITFNGGLVQQNDTGKVIEKVSMSLADVKRLYDMTQSINLPLDILSDGLVRHLPIDPAYASIYESLNPLLDYGSTTLEALTEDEIFNKAVTPINAEYLDEQIKKIPASFYEDFEVIKSRDCLLEFMPKGVTKAFGISLLAKDLAIKASEVMTLGDEENDLPMIEYAGLGVAMANAVPLIKEAADVITDSNEADGVAKAVERYVLKPLEVGGK